VSACATKGGCSPRAPSSPNRRGLSRARIWTLRLVRCLFDPSSRQIDRTQNGGGDEKQRYPRLIRKPKHATISSAQKAAAPHS
jgi:hypothetical protein